MKGKVVCDHSVIIGHTAKVEAEIEAESVLIDGEVIGNVIAKNVLEITQRGKLRGDVHTSKLVTEPGAHFDGMSKMTSQDNATEAGEHVKAPSSPGMKVVSGKV